MRPQSRCASTSASSPAATRPGRRSTALPSGCSTRWARSSIISEERHEIDAHVEASVHQVRIEGGDRPGSCRSRRACGDRGADRRARRVLGESLRGRAPRRGRRGLERALDGVERPAAPAAARPRRAPAREVREQARQVDVGLPSCISVPSPSAARSNVDVTSAPPPCAWSAACSGGRRSSTSKRMVMLGATAAAASPFAFQ